MASDQRHGFTQDDLDRMRFIEAADLSPDGRLAVYAQFTTDPKPERDHCALWLVDVESGESRRLTAGTGKDTWPAFSPDGKEVAFVSDRTGKNQIHVIPLDGEQLTAEGEEDVPLASAGRRVLFASSDFDEPRSLYLWDGDAGADRVRRLTGLNDEVLAAVALPRVRGIAARGADGEPVEGWFLEPAEGSAPYPTVLYIHGGPHGAFGHDFHADMQLLAGAGYGVILANHRASTGYGDAFATKIRGDWGNHDYRDLMAAVDRAVEMRLADPDRLGVCGLSGGGNLSCWIVGQTNRFKAAVPENPVTNFASMFGVQDLGLVFAVAEAGGAPHEVPETYARMSPITYAHRCTTPTLLVQCESDMRCPPEQSEQFYAALTLAGCPVEMLRLPGVPHGGAIFGPPAIRRAQNEALLEWMRRWIPVRRADEVASLA